MTTAALVMISHVHATQQSLLSYVHGLWMDESGCAIKNKVYHNILMRSVLIEDGQSIFNVSLLRDRACVRACVVLCHYLYGVDYEQRNLLHPVEQRQVPAWSDSATDKAGSNIHKQLGCL